MPAEPAKPQYDVFISYAREDGSDVAAQLDAALRAQGYKTWRDVRDINRAADFGAELEYAIKSSRFVVVCVTKGVTRKDSFVRREIGYAQLSQVNRPIFVALFEDIPPPISIVTYTSFDFFKNRGKALQELCQCLEEPPSDMGPPATPFRPSPPPPPPAEPPGPDEPNKDDSGGSPLADDKYKPYLENLLDFLVDALRASVIADGKIIDLHAGASPGDVPHVRRLNATLSAEALSEGADPDSTPGHFESLREAYDYHHCDGRVLLLGEPGAGKTITLLAFARDAVAARLADPSELLPLYATISGWDSRLQTPLNEWLASQHPGLSADDLQTLIEQGKVMLLLDGLDELGPPLPVNLNEPGGEKFDPRDRFLQSLPLTGKIILSSRIEEYHQIGRLAQLNCAIRLERLDDDQMQEYLRDVTGLWDAVHFDSELEEALRNPLLLKLFRVGFEGDPAGTDTLRALSGAQLDERIFDEFIRRRWEHEREHNPHDPLPLTADQLKQRLGLAVMRAGSTETREDFTRILMADVGEPDPEKVIELALRLDLLRPAGDDPVDRFAQQRRPTYRFLHLRLRDALTLPIALADLRSSIQGNESRIRAVMVLGRLGNAVAVEPLIAALSDPDTEVRIRIAIALGELKDKRAVRPLIGTLHDKDWRVKRCATNALARLGADDVLAASLSDVNADVRKGAADALVKLQIVEPLISALHDDNPDIRSTIILALERSRDPRVVPALITVLRQDSEPSVRNSAAYVLGRQDDLLALDPLIEALNDSNPDVRAMVADALGQLSDRHAVQPLVAILRDPDWYTRGRAAAALLELGAEDALIAALQDSDPRSAYAAFEVLQRLNYRPLVYQALTDFRARKLPPRRD